MNSRAKNAEKPSNTFVCEAPIKIARFVLNAGTTKPRSGCPLFQRREPEAQKEQHPPAPLQVPSPEDKHLLRSAA